MNEHLLRVENPTYKTVIDILANIIKEHQLLYGETDKGKSEEPLNSN